MANAPGAMTRLVQYLTPVIHVRVARVLMRMCPGMSSGRRREELAELVQDVLLKLVEEDCFVLRSWDPERGASLRNFIGLIAKRWAIAVLRARRRRPLPEQSFVSDQILESLLGVESHLDDRDELRSVTTRLEESLTDKGRHLFDLIFVQELPVDEIRERAELSDAAVYKWKSRIRERAREIRDELATVVNPGAENQEVDE